MVGGSPDSPPQIARLERSTFEFVVFSGRSRVLFEKVPDAIEEFCRCCGHFVRHGRRLTAAARRCRCGQFSFTGRLWPRVFVSVSYEFGRAQDHVGRSRTQRGVITRPSTGTTSAATCVGDYETNGWESAFDPSRRLPPGSTDFQLEAPRPDRLSSQFVLSARSPDSLSGVIRLCREPSDPGGIRRHRWSQQ